MRIFLAFLFLYSSASAQIFLQGKVVTEEQEPLAGVSIINHQGNEWSVSDEAGNFKLRLHSSNFELEFKALGRKSEFLNHDEISGENTIIVILREDNLRLDDVVVTAIPKRSKIGSSISLGEYAVDQVQSFSVADILQQLPGQAMTPPSLNAANSISLRTAIDEETTGHTLNQFGVSYQLDGVELSNDSNMQSYNRMNGITGYDNLNTGIDLRSIPAANIEEIEVISGIPDARYGNLTSGLIRIDRKAGLTPWTINTSIREGNTSVSLGKGFKLGRELGNLSFSLDYLNANSDPRKSLEQYDRITASAIWSSYNESRTLMNTFSITLHNNLDDMNYDKDNDDGAQDAKFKKDRGIRLSNRLNWKPGTELIDNFRLSLGYSYAYQHSYAQMFMNDGGRVVPQNMETGLSSGAYTPVAYLQIRQVYGQPVNLTANASFEKTLSSEQMKHDLSLGLNSSYSDNKGKGRGYDPANAHSQVSLDAGTGGGGLESGEGMRPLDYDRYVKPRVNLGFYVQDNLTYTFPSGKELYANMGLRYDIQNGFSSFSPRMNLGYEVTDNINIRGGLGFASKAPSLSQIYPGNKFFDVLIADFRTSSYSYNLIQTYHKEIDQLDLEPMKSWKYELGVNYNPSFGRFALTAFYNHTFEGIVSHQQIESVALPNVEFLFPETNDPPTYGIAGYSPFLLDYSLSTNGLEIKDKGMEFYFNFNKIDAINTSFDLNGTYTFSESVSELDYLRRNSDELEETFLYGIFEPSVTEVDLFRLRATITHHLSDLGLLISLSAEQFTREATYATTESVYPLAYVNPNGDRIPIPEHERQDQEYNGLRRSPGDTRDKITPTYHNFHLRATKELMNGLGMSLYAYNFLNHRPILKINEAIKIKNQRISFGAQLRYQF